MHPLSAAQGDAAMIVFQPAGTPDLRGFASFFCAFTDLPKQGPHAAQKPCKKNAASKTKHK